MAYMMSQAAANVEGIQWRRMLIFLRAGGPDMGRIIILILVLLLLSAIALVGYAYSGLMQPDVQTVTQPVELDVD
ncbi:hypothetical protein K3728_10340 [Rhodobacteraceae bacterium M385]|nr:hypothetical protein K3728_10340 [Rhodobacteraceae bacterium M385]